MAVSVDTVYQRVLALANKEQRGYITPQEFNLFANQAQLEIFEQYFYDLNQFRKVHGNDTTYADIDSLLEDKIQLFERMDEAATIAAYPSGSGNSKVLPEHVYRVHRVEYLGNSCEIMNTMDFSNVQASGGLLKPSLNRPICNIRNREIRVEIGASGASTSIPTRLFYLTAPADVRWGYLVVGEKALYNSTSSSNFQLHRGEETELIYKILKLAGISMRRDDIMRAGQGLEISQIQQEKQ